MTSPLPADVAPTWFDLRGLVQLSMHNTRQLFELQFDVWRAVLETQARTAASFGLPAAYGAVLCGSAAPRPWLWGGARGGVPPWLPQASHEGMRAMDRQFGALFGGGPASLAAQGWQQALGRCVAQADAAMRQWWEIAEQQVEDLGDAAEAGRDALLDATGPVSDLPRAVEVPDAAGAKPRRRVAGERSRRGRPA